METTVKENIMGTRRIPHLLFSVSFPIIISMLVQALYNVIDSIYVSNFDNIAGTGALTIAFPVQNLIIAVSVGLAVGTNALLSRALGEKNSEKVNKIAGQGFFLMLCGYVVFLIFGLFLLKPYISSQVSEGTLLYEYSYDYISTVCLLSFGIFIEVICERFLQATGKAFFSMLCQLSGAVVNIILDPIFIFGYLGVPAMGVKGAAIATVIGQFVAAILGLVFNFTLNKEIVFKLKNLIPDFKILKEMLAIGIPAVFMQAIGSVTTYFMNKILIVFSEEALNIFGIYFKLQSFVFMPIFGLTNGMVPIIAYNYGAKSRKRVVGTIRLGVISAVSYMLLGLLTFQLAPDLLLSLFNASALMLNIGRVALRNISWSFLLAGGSIVSIASCQAFGKSIYSLIVSAIRQLVVLIPAAFLLSRTEILDVVWFAFPIAELVGFFVAISLFLYALNKCMPKEKQIEKIAE